MKNRQIDHHTISFLETKPMFRIIIGQSLGFFNKIDWVTRSTKNFRVIDEKH